MRRKGKKGERKIRNESSSEKLLGRSRTDYLREQRIVKWKKEKVTRKDICYPFHLPLPPPPHPLL